MNTLCPVCTVILDEDNYSRYKGTLMCVDCQFDLESMCSCRRISGDRYSVLGCELHDIRRAA